MGDLVGPGWVKMFWIMYQLFEVNKAGNKTVKIVERPIITEPFESVTVDIIGPFDKAKGGVKWVFTFICLASRWLDGVPL